MKNVMNRICIALLCTLLTVPMCLQTVRAAETASVPEVIVAAPIDAPKETQGDYEIEPQSCEPTDQGEDF